VFSRISLAALPRISSSRVREISIQIHNPSTKVNEHPSDRGDSCVRTRPVLCVEIKKSINVGIIILLETSQWVFGPPERSKVQYKDTKDTAIATQLPTPLFFFLSNPTIRLVPSTQCNNPHPFPFSYPSSWEQFSIF
jgi:hypothetical protein